MWLAAWPGYFSYDTAHFTSYALNGSLSSQQSVLHTVVVGTFIRAGLYFFNSFNDGVALYICFQLAICLAFAVLLLRFIQEESSLFVFVFSTLFLALCPAISIFVVCTTKDVMFSVFLGFFCLDCCCALRSSDVSKLQLLSLAVLCFLIVAERNNGFYALLIAMPIIFFKLKPAWGLRRSSVFIACCSAGLCLGLIWNGPIARFMGAAESSSLNEMISLPVVQIARAAVDDPSVEPSSFDSVSVDLGSLKSAYSAISDNSDATRPLFWVSLDSDGLGPLVSLWLNLLPRHLGSYIVAPLVLTESAWSPFSYPSGYNYEGASYDYDKTASSVFAAWCEEPAASASKLPWLSNLLWHYSRDSPFKTYLPFAWTCSVAFYVWLLLLSLTRSIIIRNNAGVIVCTTLLCVVVTSLLGPVVLLRYYWYLMLAAPLLFLILFSVPSWVEPKPL